MHRGETVGIGLKRDISYLLHLEFVHFDHFGDSGQMMMQAAQGSIIDFRWSFAMQTSHK